MTKKTFEPRVIPEVRFQRNKLLLGNAGVVPVYSWSYDGLLVSEGHGKDFNGNWKGGGPFYMYRTGKSATTQPISWLRNNVTWSGLVGSPNLGSTLPVQPTPPSWTSEESYLKSKYATGYKRARPGNKVVDIPLFIGELKDIHKLPSLFLDWGRGSPASTLAQLPITLSQELDNFIRLAPGKYLNIEFGWKAFIKDCVSMIDIATKINDRLTNIINENGKGIDRRSQVLNEDSTSVVSVTSYPYAFAGLTAPPPTWVPGSTIATVTRRDTERVWFSGRFQYYIPNVEDTEWLYKIKAQLLGISIDYAPELIYNLVPFTWLLDYFTNLGDIIANACNPSLDNLTCKYSYVMHHKLTETKRTVQTQWDSLYSLPASPLKTAIPGGSATFETVEYTESKSRAGGGNPFGLGTRFDELTTYQTGILAALGLSRGLLK